MNSINTNCNSPLIKWTGSKRPIAAQIISHFPKTIDTYYEPFLGGGSVFFNLLKSDKNVRSFRLSDINESLIQIFKIVQTNPDELIASYSDKWSKLQTNQDVFYSERDNYNQTKDPLSFYFLTRTCYNGTIRYNSKGEFNTAFHFGRPGMHPSKIENIIRYHWYLMNGKDIEFNCRSFNQVHPENETDIVYLDPPYTNSKALYHGNIDINTLFSWIDNLPCSWYMNLNGINGADHEETIPIKFTEKLILNSGKSSYSRLKGQTNVNVGEYFYYRLK